jgi:sigma-B regulation protein RsbU (phosphoserine phosphatase)
VLFVLAVLGLVTQRSYRHATKQAEDGAMNLARIQAALLDRTLAEAARIPEMHARMFESGALRDEPTVQRYLLDVLVRTPGIYGTCLAFEPESFTPGKRNYCPYAYWKEGKPILEVLEPPAMTTWIFRGTRSPSAWRMRCGRSLSSMKAEEMS